MSIPKEKEKLIIFKIREIMKDVDKQSKIYTATGRNALKSEAYSIIEPLIKEYEDPEYEDPGYIGGPVVGEPESKEG